MRLGPKLALLGCLYFAQGLPFGFFTQAVPALLRERGVALPAIGFASLLALPWAFKFAWAPWIDRYGSARLGRRRSWILPLQLASALLLAALAAFDPARGLGPMLVGALLVNLLAATQDVASDGLAVDLLGPSERGPGNGVQVAAYRVGMIVGGGAILAAVAARGWAWACFAQSALLLLVTAPLAFYREPPPAAPPPGGALTEALLAAVRRPGVLPWLALIGAFKGGDALATAMLSPLLVDAGLGLAELGWIRGTVGSAAGLAGALLGGALVPVLGRRPALVAFGALQGVGVALYVPLALGAAAPSAFAALVGVEHALGGMATAALFTVMMDACRPEAAATDYTLQACAVVLASGLAAALSGVLAEALGYAGLFGLSAALAFAAAVWVGRSRHPFLAEPAARATVGQ